MMTPQYIYYTGCVCIPCSRVGSIPLGNMDWLPGTPSPYRGRRRRHQHYSDSHTNTFHFHYSQYCLLPAGVSVALTWLGNLRVGLGPPGYRGDINGWKKWQNKCMFSYSGLFISQSKKRYILKKGEYNGNTSISINLYWNNKIKRCNQIWQK